MLLGVLVYEYVFALRFCRLANTMFKIIMRHETFLLGWREERTVFNQKNNTTIN